MSPLLVYEPSLLECVVLSLCPHYTIAQHLVASICLISVYQMMSLNARIQVHVIAATFRLSFIHFFSQNLLSIRNKKVNKTYSP